MTVTTSIEERVCLCWRAWLETTGQTLVSHQIQFTLCAFFGVRMTSTSETEGQALVSGLMRVSPPVFRSHVG